MIRIFSSVLISLFFLQVQGQKQLAYHPDYLILKYQDEVENVQKTISYRNGVTDLTLEWEKELYGKRSIHRYRINTESDLDLEVLCDNINIANVEWISPDYKVEQRITPNDNFFSQQWDMEIIQAVEAWDITTGGTTINGDTIVVAIIDSGFYLDHEDLKDNIWINRDEIPEDGLDNDGNLVIDDYMGYNFIEDSPIHSFNSHGTAVTGIVGAKGDNGVGVTGVNWDVRYLLVTGVSLVSHVIESYDYVLKQRTIYNDTDGAKGAYIVSSNFSAGVPNAFPDSGPAFEIWCNLYDDLGKAGILNVSATANENEDVDVVGDMPSTCNSPYLIVVTNTNESDNRVSTAGFGPIHVDLGAPGTSTFTVASEGTDDYGTFPGTSASCPHVAGAVALIFSAPCQEFMNLYSANPGDGVMAMRQAIFDGVDPNTSLEGITSTGGRLNIFKSMEQLRTFCSGTTGDLKIMNVFPNPISDSNLTIQYQAPDFGNYTLDIFNSIGQLVYTRAFSPPFFGDEKTLFVQNTGQWSNGTYYIRIQSDSDKVSSSFMKFD